MQCVIEYGRPAFRTGLGIDQVLHSVESRAIVMEDSAKFIGIFSWFAFHTLTVLLALTGARAAVTHDDDGHAA